MKLRILYNEFSSRYRIERKRWWGWTFITEPSGFHYLGFDKLEQAEDWIERCYKKKNLPSRRWRQVKEIEI
jgi:hypothetical protein